MLFLNTFCAEASKVFRPDWLLLYWLSEVLKKGSVKRITVLFLVIKKNSVPSDSVEKSIQKSYLSKRKDVLKYYVGKSESHPYEKYLSKSTKVSDIKF